MDRRTLISVGLLLTVLALAVLVLQAPTPAPLNPAPPSVEQIERSKVVLRRPKTNRPSPKPLKIEVGDGERPVLIEVEPKEVPFEPMQLTDLPTEDLERIAPIGLERMRDLHDVCADFADPQGTNVAIAMTVDDRGLLEMELGHWSGETAAFTGEPLPEALIDCLDDEVWALDWPVWEGGLRFALTTQFDPGDPDLD